MRRAVPPHEAWRPRRARGPVTAARMAEELEIIVRTVYRDVASLIGNGVPIVGEAGIGYVLGDGFDLPPLMFNADELEALMLVRGWSKRGATALHRKPPPTPSPNRRRGSQIPASGPARRAADALPRRRAFARQIDASLIRRALREQRSFSSLPERKRRNHRARHLADGVGRTLKTAASLSAGASCAEITATFAPTVSAKSRF